MSDTFDPAYDGVTHCNVLHVKAATRLGRLLSNLADVSVHHPTHGRFRTAEGLWYYLKTGCKHDDLRSMSGYEAKTFGKKLEVVWLNDFKEQFTEGLVEKIKSHDELKNLFLASTLPFVHYYCYYSKKPGVPPRVIAPKDSQWLMDVLTELRADPSLWK